MDEITKARPSTAVVLFSGDPTVTLSPREMSATAAIAFLSKPAPPKALDSTLRLAVFRARELAAARQDATTARQQLEERKVIERAKGILMRRTGTTEQEAFKVLQRATRTSADG